MAFQFDPTTARPVDAPKKFEFDPTGAVLEKEGGGPGFIPTIKRTGGQMLTTAATSAEDVIGPNTVTKAVRETGQDIIDRNPAGITKLRDVVDSPWLAVKEAVGQFAPQIGAAAAGGFAGARVGGTLGALAGPGGAAAGAAIGGVAGGLLPIVTQTYGGIREEQKEAGQEDKTRAMLATIPAAALERIGMGKALSVLKGVPGAAAGSIAKEVGKGVLKEGATEGTQNVIEQWGAFKDPTKAENLEDTALSAVMGGIGGGVAGGASGVVDSSRRRAQQQDNRRMAESAAASANGLTEQAQNQPAPLQLGNAPPDQLVSFPDGSVGRRGEVESYLANLPEEERAAARAKLMGQAYTEVNDPQARRWWEGYADGEPQAQRPDYLAEVQQAVRTGTPFSTQQTVDTVRNAMEDAWLAQNVQPDATDPGAPAQAADAIGAQLQGEFDQAGEDSAIAAADVRVRTGRILSGLQNILDGGADNTVQVLGRLNDGLARINEVPLAADEVGRVRRMVDAYMGFKGVGEAAPLPGGTTAALKAMDAFADNAGMEALIPERQGDGGQRDERGAEERASAGAARAPR